MSSPDHDPPPRWLPWALVALCLVPAVAGSARLLQLALGAVPADGARFAAAPVPVVVHIVGSLVFGVLGAFQFAGTPTLAARARHRRRGPVLVAAGLAAALSGLWMTERYPAAGFDGPVLYGLRWLAGLGMTASLGLGVAALGRGDGAAHGAWMRRAYALGLGAGTQVFTHLPWALWPEARGEALRTVLMAAGWAINLAVAQAAIARSRARQRGLRPARRGAAGPRRGGCR